MCQKLRRFNIQSWCLEPSVGRKMFTQSGWPSTSKARGDGRDRTLSIPCCHQEALEKLQKHEESNARRPRHLKSGCFFRSIRSTGCLFHRKSLALQTGTGRSSHFCWEGPMLQVAACAAETGIWGHGLLRWCQLSVEPTFCWCRLMAWYRSYGVWGTADGWDFQQVYDSLVRRFLLSHPASLKPSEYGSVTVCCWSLFDQSQSWLHFLHQFFHVLSCSEALNMIQLLLSDVSHLSSSTSPDFRLNISGCDPRSSSSWWPKDGPKRWHRRRQQLVFFPTCNVKRCCLYFLDWGFIL